MPNPPRKILFLYSCTGGGHLRVAQTLAEEVRRLAPTCPIALGDGLRRARWGVTVDPARAYALLTIRLIGVFNLLYRLQDNPDGVRRLRALIAWIWGSSLTAVIDRESPDLVVSTHLFLSPSICDGTTHHPRWVTVVTDLGTPSLLWFDPASDAVIVPTPEIGVYACQRARVPRERLIALDYEYPINRQFVAASESVNRSGTILILITTERPGRGVTSGSARSLQVTSGQAFALLGLCPSYQRDDRCQSGRRGGEVTRRILAGKAVAPGDCTPNSGMTIPALCDAVTPDPWAGAVAGEACMGRGPSLEWLSSLDVPDCGWSWWMLRSIRSSIDGQAVVLAALLHDVGKFWQRTGAPSPPTYVSFDRTDYGAHGAHAKWSAACYEEIIPLTWRRGAHDVLTHHRPVNYSAKIVALADHLAASERDDREADDATPETARLIPVFARIHAATDALAGRPTYSLSSLRLDRTALYPHPTHASDPRRDYTRLWEGFISEARQLTSFDSFEPLVLTLLALLEKYTWCVPSAAYRSLPDVSLSDHARVTAAFAACLWLAAPAESELDELLADPSRRSLASTRSRFALFGGDLSGVQRFLYTLASRGAARTLRGRSLYLQMLSEAAADALRRELDLPLPNLLYVGGAKFYVLAPAEALTRLDDLRRRFAASFLALTEGELYLALGGVALSAADVATSFARAWDEVGAELRIAKTRRLAEIAQSSYPTLFEPRGRGGSTGAGDACDVCARPIADGEIRDGVLRCETCTARPASPVPLKVCVVCRREVAIGFLRAGTIVCDACDAFRDLGEMVARASPTDRLFLTISSDPPPASAPAWQRSLFEHFERRWEIGPRPRLDRSEALTYSLNDLDFRASGAHAFRLGTFVAPRVRPGEHAPRDVEKQETGEIKSFEWLAGEATGVPYLGLLRMDVDGLGGIFRSGLGDAATPSRVASLSRSLRVFFEGWLGELVREVERAEGDAAERIAVIYSGGDDLFVVGPWDRLPRLARTIRRELGRFCAENPRLTISAGLAVADPHYPLYQFADEAKQALDERAKAYRRPNGPAKDAISFLGVTLGWEEFDTVAARVSELRQLVQEPSPGRRRVPRALIHSFARLAEEHRREPERAERLRQRAQGRTPWTAGRWLTEHPPGGAGGERIFYGRWLWLAHYQLARFAERLGRPGESPRREVEALARELIQPERIGSLGLIARWAEYLVRGEE